MKRIILVGLMSVYILLSAYFISYAKEVIYFNSWETNPLSLTRVENRESSGELAYVDIPAAILADKQGVYIFDLIKPFFVKISESGEVIGTYYTSELEYWTYCLRPFAIEGEKIYGYITSGYDVVEYDMAERNQVKLFSVEHLDSLYFDKNEQRFYHFSNLGSILFVYGFHGNIIKEMNLKKRYADWGQEYFYNENYARAGMIYSPVEEYIDVNRDHFSSCISKYSLESGKVEKICSKGHKFGFYIIGVDDKGRIFTVKDYDLSSIYVHSQDGALIKEITPDYMKYGTDEDVYFTEYTHIPYVRDNGDVFLLVRVTKGLYVIKYSLSDE